MEREETGYHWSVSLDRYHAAVECRLVVDHNGFRVYLSSGVEYLT
jgi:hypothetical protein